MLEPVRTGSTKLKNKKTRKMFCKQAQLRQALQPKRTT
jgi:hypothetical protein